MRVHTLWGVGDKMSITLINMASSASVYGLCLLKATEHRPFFAREITPVQKHLLSHCCFCHFNGFLFLPCKFVTDKEAGSIPV